MPDPTINTITPGLGRANDAGVVIAGADFLASGNTVTVDGVPAIITAESTASITITVVGPIALRQFVEVVVTATGETMHLWWSRATVAQLQTLVLALQQRGPAEVLRDDAQRPDPLALSPPNPFLVEAKDYQGVERLVTWPNRILTLRNQLFVGTGPPGNRPAPPLSVPANGEMLVYDPDLAEGNAQADWKVREGLTLHWGAQIGANDAGFHSLQANGLSTDPNDVNTDWAIGANGHINMIWCHVGRVQNAGETITGIVLERDGNPVYDSDTETTPPTIAQDGTYVATTPWIPISASDKLRFMVIKSVGTTTTLDVRGYVQVM